MNDVGVSLLAGTSFACAWDCGLIRCHAVSMASDTPTTQHETATSRTLMKISGFK